MRSPAVVAFAILFTCGPVFGQRVITTFAGTQDSSIPPNTTALGLAFSPFSAASDRSGNLYAVSQDTNRVVKIDKGGNVSLFAGNGFPTFSGDGGLAVNASLWQPSGIAFDLQGNAYITDSRNNRIRRVDTAGIITTFAGNGAASYNSGAGVAAAATTYFPNRISTDSAGNIWFADLATVRRMDPSGSIVTVAGNGLSIDPNQGQTAPDPALSDGGPATSATLGGPTGIAIDASGNLYLAEYLSNRIRRVDGQSGIITTIAGDGVGRWAGDGGPASTASINYPQGLTIDSGGNLFIADYGNSRIRRIDTSGTITTVAGTGALGYGDESGAAANEPVAWVWNIAEDSADNLLITDFYSGRVRRVDSNGVMATVIGSGRKSAPDDGLPARQAHISPIGLVFDKQQNLIVADANNLIKRIGPDGTISTLAGNGRTGSSGDGGIPTNATLNTPFGVAVDPAGNIFVADTFNNLIRKISTAGTVSTFAGTGLVSPQGLAFDTSGILYVADTGNHRVLRFAADGTSITVAGTGSLGYSGDGGPAVAATLNQPGALAFDPAGNLLIADTFNNAIRRVDSNGNIATLAGGGTQMFVPDGTPGTAVKLFWPQAVIVDKNGLIYFSDTHNGRVFQLTLAGNLINVAGTGQTGYSGDGGPAVNAALNLCPGLALDAAGNLFISDNYNQVIREVLAAPPAAQLSGGNLNFSATSNGTPTQPQNLIVSSGLPGAAFNAIASTTDGGAWLKISAANGAAPANVNVLADPAGLVPGAYQGTVSFNMPGFSPASLSAQVSLLVLPAAAPQLSIQPGAISFTVAQQSGPSAQVVFVNNLSGSATFQASPNTDSGGGWLQVATVNGTASPAQPGSVNVAADVSGLSPGAYSGSIIVSSDTGSTRVPVALTVTPSNRAHILVSQTALSFTTNTSGGGGLAQIFGVLNTGAGSMNWTASSSGGSWLFVTQQSSVSQANSLQVPLAAAQVKTTGMAPGTYKGAVTISSPDADNSPQTIPVVLQVLDPSQTLGPAVRPTGLIFTTREAGASPGSQPTNIFNFSTQAIDFSANASAISGGNWLQISTTSGRVPSAVSSGVLAVNGQVNTPSLKSGIYDGGISILFGNNNFQNVSVLLVVIPNSTPTSALSPAVSSTTADAANSCQPTRLRIVFTQNQDNFVAPAGVPVSIGLSVVDDCGNPMRSGSVVASLNNGDAAIPLVSLQNGDWSGTWIPEHRIYGQVGLTVQAQSLSGTFGATTLRGIVQ